MLATFVFILILFSVHCGNENGFLPNALLVFSSHSEKEDYHGDMNAENFFKWADEKVIPNLPPNSVVIIDNAPYHNKLKDPPPTSANRKQEIYDWLSDKVFSF